MKSTRNVVTLGYAKNDISSRGSAEVLLDAFGDVLGKSTVLLLDGMQFS